jgi:hypothetical protein
MVLKISMYIYTYPPWMEPKVEKFLRMLSSVFQFGSENNPFFLHIPQLSFQKFLNLIQHSSEWKSMMAVVSSP